MRSTTILAWSAWTGTVLLAAFTVALALIDRSVSTERGSSEADPGLAYLGLFLAFSTVGALIGLRQPGNSVGWLFCAVGGSALLGGASERYAHLVLREQPGSLAGGAAAWLAGWLLGPSLIGLIAVVLLIFPTGQLPSGRWRPFRWASLAGLALAFASSFRPGMVENISFAAENPFGVRAAADVVFETLKSASFALMVGATASGVVALALRLTRARGDERQQLKWFAYAGALFCGLFIVGPIIWSVPSLEGSLLWPVLFLAGMGALPISVGIAILRYRLYDIDALINRTLVYGAVVAALVATYFAAVVAIQAVLRPFTSGSELAVAGSTLLVVALFQPLRRRVQDAVDRRFYRSRYDAARTLDAFAMRLRDEVDLDSVRADLLDVVRETVRPAHASVWLRERR